MTVSSLAPAVRWCPPAELYARPGTRHVAPGSSHWRGPAWKSQAFIDQALPVYRHVIDWAQTQDWWHYVPRPGERRMFSVWFAHAIGDRHYSNPLVHDLYLFHDLLHAYTFIDAPGDATDRWKLRMRANEIMVSLETEVLVYARCPGLRPKSFDQEIWADAFLARGGVSGRPEDFGIAIEHDMLEQQLLAAASVWPLPCPGGWSGLWWARRCVSRWPRPECAMEQAIARYEEEASREYEAWGERWRQVEHYRQGSMLRYPA